MERSLSLLERITEGFGGITRAAEELGVTQSAIYNWSAQGYVPAERCPTIERLIGVRCELLNHKVEWYVLRGEKQENGAGAGLNEAWWHYAC